MQSNAPSRAEHSYTARLIPRKIGGIIPRYGPPCAMGSFEIGAPRDWTDEPQPGESGWGSLLHRQRIDIMPMLAQYPNANPPGPNFRLRPAFTTLMVSLTPTLLVKNTPPHPPGPQTSPFGLSLSNL